MEDDEYVVNHNVEFAATGWRIDGTGDFDADGDDDVIWRHHDGAVVTWEMEDNDYVHNHNIEFASTGWEIDGTGDFDADGDADILWRHQDGDVVTWEMENGAYVVNHNLAAASTAWHIKGPATSTATAMATSCGATTMARSRPGRWRTALWPDPQLWRRPERLADQGNRGIRLGVVLPTRKLIRRRRLRDPTCFRLANRTRRMDMHGLRCGPVRLAAIWCNCRISRTRGTRGSAVHSATPARCGSDLLRRRTASTMHLLSLAHSAASELDCPSAVTARYAVRSTMAALGARVGAKLGRNVARVRRDKLDHHRP